MFKKKKGKKRGYIIYIYIFFILPLATCVTKTTYVCFCVVKISFCAPDQQNNRPNYISNNNIVYKGGRLMANSRFTESSDLVVFFPSAVSSENTESKVFANLSIPCIFLVS